MTDREWREGDRAYIVRPSFAIAFRWIHHRVVKVRLDALLDNGQWLVVTAARRTWERVIYITPPDGPDGLFRTHADADAAIVVETLAKE